MVCKIGYLCLVLMRGLKQGSEVTCGDIVECVIPQQQIVEFANLLMIAPSPTLHSNNYSGHEIIEIKKMSLTMKEQLSLIFEHVLSISWEFFTLKTRCWHHIYISNHSTGQGCINHSVFEVYVWPWDACVALPIFFLLPCQTLIM